ncbi:hypothetical protein FGRMN_5546 [Fusarium graminum]|nr:hypothetical protein FGRMN_5546 [Fusarium graminum]
MSKEKMSNRMLTTIVFVVSTIFILTLLAFHRTADFRTIIPITIQDDVQEVQEPTERFLIALTGPKMHDMKKTPRPKSKLVGSPRAENPIGNPELPGITSSGGKNWAMYMATEFNTTLTLAYIFARSASVVDAEVIPPRRKTTFTFAHQIAQFKETIGHRPRHAAWTAENTVVTVWFGLNDLSIALGKEGQDKRLRASIGRMFELTEILYKMGIRNFIFIEMPPIELLPSHQTVKLRNDGRHELYSYAATVWNKCLRQNTILFQQTHRDAKANYIEVWDIFYQAFLQPQSLGAKNSTCVDPEGKTCLWADAHHPGRRIHRLIGARVAENAWGNEG